MRCMKLVCLLILLPLFSGLVTATPSGLTYLDSVSTGEDYTETTHLEITNDYIVAVHDDALIIYDRDDKSVVKTFEIPGVSYISASETGEFLALNRAYSVQEPKTLNILDLNQLILLDKKGYSDYNSKDISWHPSGDFIASPGKDGDVVILRYSDMSVKNTLHSVHHVEITCIEYSGDGEYLITGDESGRYALWNQNGTLVDTYRSLDDEGVIDCKWTPDGENYILVGDKGVIVSRNLAGATNGEVRFDGAVKLNFARNGNVFHLAVENDTSKGIISLNFDNLQEEYKTSFFHRIYDFEIIDDQFGRLNKIFVAMNSGEIAIYQKNIYHDGYLQPGVDTDYDKIPDTYDTDDDGDGIYDDWDNDFGCDAPVGTPCSLYPDISKIRKITIDLSPSSMTIHDRISLPSSISSDIRNLSRNSMATDQIISINEQKMFESSICSNIVLNELTTSWESSLQFSTGELGDAQVFCSVESGLQGIKQGDTVTQINFIISVSFTFDSNIVYPLNLTIQEQTTPTTGSISWVAPSHPISVSITGDSIEDDGIPIWRNDGMPLIFDVNQEEIVEKTTLDGIIDIITNPLVLIMAAMFLVSIGLFYKRRIDKFALNLEEDVQPEAEEIVYEQDDFDDDYDIEEDLPDAFTNEVDEDEFYEEPKVTTKKKISPNNKDLTPMSNIGQKKIRRTSAKGIENGKTEVKKTKRKKLSSVEGLVESTSPIKRKTVKTTAKETVVKKKSVKKTVQNKDKDVNQQKPAPIEKTENENTAKKTNRRKPVRRKNKNSEKIIDETKLQDDLLDSFTKEESPSED